MNAQINLSVGGEFDGIGLLALGLHLAGLKHAWLCEVDPWRRSILEQRFPGIPVFDDVRAVGAASARRVDVIAGGFPCKGVSAAGKREGFGHPETVLWREMFRTVCELRPRYVLVENVADLLNLRPPGGHSGDLAGEVYADLASVGFDLVGDVLPAAAVGAPHLRQRFLAVAAHPDGVGWGEGVGDVRAGQLDAEGSAEAPTNAEGRAAWAGEQTGSERAGRSGSKRGDQAPPDSASGLPGSGAPVSAKGLATEPDGGDGQAASDPPRDAQGGPEPPAGTEWERARIRRGVAVDWGEFGPAIERWERVHGRAPEPLVRRVDDGSTRRLERSRLSALGDGVCVQVGFLVGRYIVERERERVAA